MQQLYAKTLVHGVQIFISQQAKSKNSWLWVTICVLSILLFSASLSQGTLASDLFAEGQKAEAQLDLFSARDAFRAALQEDPTTPGLIEHTAWFLYINGFHNRECLELLIACKPVASDPPAVGRAIEQLEEELGLRQATSHKPPTPEPPTSPSDLPGRLRYARELWWSGQSANSIEEYNKLLAEFPNEPALKLEIARVYISQKKYHQADRYLKEARKSRPHEPEIALEQSHSQALRGHQLAATLCLNGVTPDSEKLHLAKARAYHYSAQFHPAAREYRMVLATAPYFEEAAYGLAECDTRIGNITEANTILKTWPPRAVSQNWSDRIKLYRQFTAPQILAQGQYYKNNIGYRTVDIGADGRFRVIDPLEMHLITTHGWFRQSGFHGFGRQTGSATLTFQPNETWSLTGKVGVNGYSNNWVSVPGGIYTMVRPISSLKLEVQGEHLDVVDNELPFGIALYDLATTIGATGARATMTQLATFATFQPVERVEFFGKYRIAEISIHNRLIDYYLSIKYTLLRKPEIKIGYSYYHESLLNAAPVYREGTSATPAYYDPDDLSVHCGDLYWMHDLGHGWLYGLEGHIYGLPKNGGLGLSGFAYLRYSFAKHHALRGDVRYFTQNQGLTRSGNSGEGFNAWNFVFTYEFTF